MENTEDRLINLESKFALLEDSYLRLSDEFAVQQRELRLLNQQCEYLREVVKSTNQSPIGNAADEPPPPHY